MMLFYLLLWLVFLVAIMEDSVYEMGLLEDVWKEKAHEANVSSDDYAASFYHHY